MGTSLLKTVQTWSSSWLSPLSAQTWPRTLTTALTAGSSRRTGRAAGASGSTEPRGSPRDQLLAQVPAPQHVRGRRQGPVLDGSLHWRASQREPTRRMDLASQKRDRQWFDWADGQPNNHYGQYCMGMMEVHDPWYFYRDYFWNDLDCDGNHHYICEKKCPQY